MGSWSPGNHTKELDDSGYVQDDGAAKELPAVEAQSSANLLDFSDDVLLCILQFCTPLELKAVGYTCTRLGTLVLDRTLWVNVDARGAPTGGKRLRWMLTHALSVHTNSLKLTGYAREARECLGFMSGTSFNTPLLDTMPKPVPGEDVIKVWCPGAKENEPTGPGERNHSQDAQPSTSSAAGLHQSNEDEDTSGQYCPGPRVTMSQAALRQLTALCTNLTELVLEYVVLDCNMTKISMFPETLRVLSLTGTKCYNLEKTYLAKIQDHLAKLEALSLSECDWLEPANLLPLSKLPRLTALYLRNCCKLSEFVAYASLATRYGFKELKILDLRGSPVGDSEVSALGWLMKLEQLYLAPAAPEPRLVSHAHFSGDAAPGPRELQAWEAEEPEYYKAKYETEPWVKEERTRPELARFGNRNGLGSYAYMMPWMAKNSARPEMRQFSEGGIKPCIMLEHVGGPGTDPTGENLPKEPPPGAEIKAWSKETLGRMGYAISKDGMRRTITMYREADYDSGEASSDEEESTDQSADLANGSAVQVEGSVDQGAGTSDQGKGSANQENGSVDDEGEKGVDQEKKGEGSADQGEGSMDQVKGSENQGKGSADQGDSSKKDYKPHGFKKRKLDDDDLIPMRSRRKGSKDQVKGSVDQRKGSANQGKGSANQENGSVDDGEKGVDQEKKGVPGEGSADQGKGSADQGDNSKKDNYKPDRHGFNKRKFDDDDEDPMATMRKCIRVGKGSEGQVEGSVDQGEGSLVQEKRSANQEKTSEDQVKGSTDTGKGSANQEKESVGEGEKGVDQETKGEGSVDQGKGSANQENGSVDEGEKGVDQEKKGKGSVDQGKGSANQEDNSKKDNYKPDSHDFKKRKFDDDDPDPMATMRKWMGFNKFGCMCKKIRQEQKASSSKVSSNNASSSFELSSSRSSDRNCSISETNSSVIEPSLSVSEPSTSVNPQTSSINQPSRSSINEPSSSMNEPTSDLDNSNHKINRDVPTKGSRKHFDGTQSPDPEPLHDTDSKNGTGTGPKDEKNKKSRDDSSDGDDYRSRRGSIRSGIIIIAGTPNRNNNERRRDPDISRILDILGNRNSSRPRYWPNPSEDSPCSSFLRNLQQSGNSRNSENSSISREPNPSTSSEPNPSTSREPNPSTSSEPNPSTSSEPNPSTSSEPNPSTSRDPNPSTSREPIPSTSREPNPSTSREPNPSTSQPSWPLTSNQKQGYVQFSRNRPPVFIESYYQPPQAMEGSTTHPTCDSSRTVITCRNFPERPLVIGQGSRRPSVQGSVNPVNDSDQQNEYLHRNCTPEDHGTPIEGCSCHIIIGPCPYDDNNVGNNNVRNNNDVQQPDWNTRRFPDDEISEDPLFPRRFSLNPRPRSAREIARERLLYVNSGRRRHAMYQLRMPEDDDISRSSGPRTAEMSLLYSSHYIPRLQYALLITDAAVRRFGRADNDNVNYVEIGPRGIGPPRYVDPFGRPSRSNLRVLSVTGFRNITDFSLMHLATAAPDMEFIDFTGSSVTDVGVENFRHFRPDCQVRYGYMETAEEDKLEENGMEIRLEESSDEDELEDDEPEESLKGGNPQESSEEDEPEEIPMGDELDETSEEDEPEETPMEDEQEETSEEDEPEEDNPEETPMKFKVRPHSR